MSESGICKRISEYCEKSSQTQRIVLISLIASLSLIIILLGILVHHHSLLIDGCHDVICVHEASKFIKRINAEEEPCTDFNKFVCKNIYFNYIGKKCNQEVEDRKINELHNILLKYDDNDSDALKLSKKLYRACLTETDVEYTDVVKEKIQLVDGWPVVGQQNVNWLQAVGNVNNLGIPLNIFLGLTVDAVFYNKTLLKVIVPPLDSTITFNGNKNRWKRMAIELGAEESVIKEAFSSISTFLTTSNMGESHFELITLNDLQLQCKNLNWIQFFQIFLGRDNEISANTLIVADILQINKRLDLLTSTPKDTLTNYMIWKVIDKLTFFLLKNSYEATRKHFCVKTLTNTFSLNPIDIEHSKKYLSKIKIDAVTALTKNIANAYAKTLKIDKKLYNNIQSFIDKMTSIKVVVGPSKNDLEDIKVILNQDLTFLELVLLCNRLQKHWLFSKFDKNSLMPWHINSYFFTPRYYEKYNTLFIPSSAVDEIYFNELRPNYANYGSLGPLISYEFIKFVHENLLEKEVMRNQSMCFEPKVLAHAVSVQISRKAYAVWVNTNKKEHKLINLVYEPEQLFWISASPTVCDTSLHTLLNNIPEFTNDFRCIKTNNNCNFLL